MHWKLWLDYPTIVIVTLKSGGIPHNMRLMHKIVMNSPKFCYIKTLMELTKICHPCIQKWWNSPNSAIVALKIRMEFTKIFEFCIKNSDATWNTKSAIVAFSITLHMKTWKIARTVFSNYFNVQPLDFTVFLRSDMPLCVLIISYSWPLLQATCKVILLLSDQIIFGMYCLLTISAFKIN